MRTAVVARPYRPAAGASPDGGASGDARIAPPPPAARIQLRIDELVLHGFEPRDRHTLADALQRELGRLLREDAPRWIDAVGVGGLDRDRIDGGAVELVAGATPQGIGIQLARALHACVPHVDTGIPARGPAA